ncbi:DUF3231 family protein [Virgibacillus byunsanensis]|uniref:DUF3231 family protein n=1 Tax=Virgibacillus byunsanensis TaxID=570945 RepID=A0ABW3LPX9_9BACI
MENTLNTSEVTSLFNSYLGNSMAVGVTTYFIKTAEDPQVISVLETALDVAIFNTQEAKKLLNQFGHPSPEVFTDEDIDFKAPALYKDNVILFVKYILAQDAGPIYSVSFSESTSYDVRQYYLASLTKTSHFMNELVGLMEQRGLFHPKISVPVPESIGKVRKQSFVGGWLSGDRPLNTAEITQLVTNHRNLELQHEFLRSFAQVTSSKELKEHYKRGEKIAKKQMGIFQSLLQAYNLPNFPTWENEITDSTVAPFSERIMLYKLSVFVAATVSRYGTSLGTIMRKDIGVDFSRLMAETALYGEDTLNLMIKYGFLDEFPMAKVLPK